MNGFGRELWRWLTGRGPADADAAHLRELYGADAEAWCAGALAALAHGDPRRKSIRKMARALRRIPRLNVKGERPSPVRPVSFTGLMAHRRP